MLRGKGIGYDTGFNVTGAPSQPLDAAVIRRELEIIRDDLHCTAVRLIGTDMDQMEIAARHAAGLGLETWINPYPYEATPDEARALLADAAARAERVRRDPATRAEVVLVAGAELSIFTSGFLPGDAVKDRVAGLLRRDGRSRELIKAVPPAINDFLANIVKVIRKDFTGTVTYAAIPFEGVDWTPFDIISLDLSRSKEVADVYQQGIRDLVAQGRTAGKPVAITEFGCTTYTGAAGRGAMGHEGVVVYEGATPVGLNGNLVRNETEQSAYLRDLLGVFTTEGVDAAFACTFIMRNLPHRADPRLDLDMASWGIVKVFEDRCGDTYPDMTWEPKEAFGALAECYRS